MRGTSSIQALSVFNSLNCILIGWYLHYKRQTACNLLKHRIVMTGRRLQRRRRVNARRESERIIIVPIIIIIITIISYHIMYRRRFGRYFDNITINIMRSIYYMVCCIVLVISSFKLYNDEPCHIAHVS